MNLNLAIPKIEHTLLSQVCKAAIGMDRGHSGCLSKIGLNKWQREAPLFGSADGGQSMLGFRNEVGETAYRTQATQPENPFPMNGSVKQGAEPQHVCQVRHLVLDLAQAIMRNDTNRAFSDGGIVVIEIGQRIGMQVNEVSRYL
jgi:hypothetical protein